MLHDQVWSTTFLKVWRSRAGAEERPSSDSPDDRFAVSLQAPMSKYRDSSVAQRTQRDTETSLALLLFLLPTETQSPSLTSPLLLGSRLDLATVELVQDFLVSAIGGRWSATLARRAHASAERELTLGIRLSCSRGKVRNNDHARSSDSKQERFSEMPWLTNSFSNCRLGMPRERQRVIRPLFEKSGSSPWAL